MVVQLSEFGDSFLLMLSAFAGFTIDMSEDLKIPDSIWEGQGKKDNLFS